MLRAHSLLYAIYICLLVSIVCGALLYFSNLYTLLNLHYNLQEELFIQNQSTLNFVLGNQLNSEEITKNENSDIENSFTTKSYGLLTVLQTKSSLRNDTITSIHLVGGFANHKTAIYLANFTKSLSYSGKVKIKGDCFLPAEYIETSYITNQLNNLTVEGKKNISEIKLPELNPKFYKIIDGFMAEKKKLSDIEKTKDSLYYNSFANSIKEINIPSQLGNFIFKGNFILTNKDSIRVSKSAHLEDIILISPKITFEEGFSGNVQVFATKGIELEENVTLNYPSVIAVQNQSNKESMIRIKKKSKITGAVVLYGNSIENIDKNTIQIDENGLIFGDIYCSGKLDLKSNVYGSVFTNRFFYKTASSSYDNLISNIEINTNKRPLFYIPIALFETKITKYGIIKKVL